MMNKMKEKAVAAETLQESLWEKNALLAWFKRNFGSLIALILMCVLLSVTTDTFLVSKNLLSTLRNVCVNCLIAFGITSVLISGGIDLSVGSVVAASGVLAVRLANAGIPVFVCIVVALFFGALIGFFNGMVIAHTDLPAFIVTLSTQIIVRGVSYILTGGQPTQCVNERFNGLGTGNVLCLPIPIIVVIVTGLVLFLIMNRTSFGRHVYAVGGNREAAKYAGVNVKWVQVRVFMISGVTAALAGVVLAARLYSGQPNVGEGFERDAIAASVLGGTSMGGGVGTLGGTVIGVLIIGVLNNGMNLLKIDTYWQYVVKGAVILAAVYIDFIKRARNKKNK